MKETYLGDGLYAEEDGYQVVLWADRGDGRHYVALDPYVLEQFIGFCVQQGYLKPKNNSEQIRNLETKQ